MFSKKKKDNSEILELSENQPLEKNKKTIKEKLKLFSLTDNADFLKSENEIKLQMDIYKHIIKEESAFKAAFAEKGVVPYPCNCGNLCDYRTIMEQMVNAFNKLYKIYENLFVDYQVLYFNDETIPMDEQVDLKFPKKIEKLIDETNNENLNNFFDNLFSSIWRKSNLANGNDNVISLENQTRTPFTEEYESQFIQNMEQSIVTEDQEGHNYIKSLAKMQVIRKSKPLLYRLILWIISQFSGHKPCICLHCSDRDNLNVYRLAIYALYKEYRDVYIDFLGLYYADTIVGMTENYKVLIPSDKYMMAKLMATEFFRSVLENLVTS